MSDIKFYMVGYKDAKCGFHPYQYNGHLMHKTSISAARMSLAVKGRMCVPAGFGIYNFDDIAGHMKDIETVYPSEKMDDLITERPNPLPLYPAEMIEEEFRIYYKNHVA